MKKRNASMLLTRPGTFSFRTIFEIYTKMQTRSSGALIKNMFWESRRFNKNSYILSNCDIQKSLCKNRNLKKPIRI